MNRATATIFSLAILLASNHAFAIVDPPTFSPATPNSSQPVTALVRNGICHAFLAPGLPGSGIPPLRIERSPGVVDIISPGVISFDPFCINPFEIDSFTIGVLDPGNYQVRIWIIDFTVGFLETTLVASSPLTVTQGPVAQPIPMLGPGAFVMMVLLVLLIALRFLGGHRRSMFVMLAFLGSVTASAQSEQKSLMVLLSTSPNAPLPIQLVAPVEFTAGYLGELSAGLVAENPTHAHFLLSRRATGDFSTWLNAHPDEPRAQLERYVVVVYPESANLQNALSALTADPNVLYAAEPVAVDFATPPDREMAPLLPNPIRNVAKGTPTQTWVTDLGFSGAWTRAGGYGLVATLDNGLNTSHPDLAAFDSSGLYTGGNFLPVYSGDVGRSTSFPPGGVMFDGDVDERQPVTATSAVCDPDGDGLMVASIAGHGTHVAGLIGANDSNADGTVGGCKHCGIASWRTAQELCRPSGFVTIGNNIYGVVQGLTYIADIGVQVVNQSFGGAPASLDVCATSSIYDAWCLAMRNASDRGVLMVSASGNNRTSINFPARDKRVVAVGGLEADLTFWDDRLDLPAGSRTAECPNPTLLGAGLPFGTECGSNFTPAGAGQRRQEVTMSARDVYSTIYPAVNYNTVIECGDSYGDASATDGRGVCTGTSMSAPLYSGMAGLLRSINPLVLPGDPENTIDAIGIRDVVVDSSVVPGGTLIWDAKFGYGIPRADAAASIMLGFVAGNVVKNRVTPLFSFYGSAATDWSYTTVPQGAISLIINQSANYLPQGTLVAGYPAFPESPTAVPLPPAPRANTFVLTTEYRASTSHPNLIPLYWMDRKRNTPLGCTTGAGCNTSSRDFLLLTTVADVNTAKADGFSFRGLQGYVYDRCTPEPSCIPLSAEKLYRKCNTAEDDCAIFLESERVLRESEGYTAAYPVGSNMHIGYAYPNVDTDGDGLVNGFERIIGTRHDIADSDGDGVSDGVEFPLAGIRVSDPCQGPNIQCANAPLFANSFE